jgi:hypothetical protein
VPKPESAASIRHSCAVDSAKPSEKLERAVPSLNSPSLAVTNVSASPSASTSTAPIAES